MRKEFIEIRKKYNTKASKTTFCKPCVKTTFALS